ncbi:hypothetical protein F5X68DRAFT_227671 [Plectosphaerella plurivora]|uniref:Uncharacterized protein n=1 Tax=Plectosphaerella plurivora TaxID=936078 RepID=A0A9P9AF35_9PEZI|nr:hypothetical protein F5X68DRAFT_227671 [Plectosphaerella plurivora]
MAADIVAAAGRALVAAASKLTNLAEMTIAFTQAQDWLQEFENLREALLANPAADHVTVGTYPVANWTGGIGELLA